MTPYVVAAVIIGLLIVGIAFMRSRRMNNKKMFRDVLLLHLVPALLFIAIMEFIVVPAKGAQYAASLYPLFIVIWVAPASLLINRRLKKYQA